MAKESWRWSGVVEIHGSTQFKLADLARRRSEKLVAHVPPPKALHPHGDQNAAMLAAVKDKPSGWQPAVCASRDGGMAPTEQRNAAYCITLLPTRFSKEAYLE